MTYNEVLAYLYASTPDFQKVGGAAYKPGLSRSLALDEQSGFPHQAYQTIHVGGTNGKGSVSHLLSAVLQLSGYKTGLFTSPHLVDFRERIRVDGAMISREYVTNYVNSRKNYYEQLKPSFFEVTSSMAFDYFKDEQVDVAIIEVGLGGRLDSTNIISPALSVITNISFDHTQFLGDSLEKIAEEKAGIIKPHTPIVVGNAVNASIRSVFEEKALSVKAPIYFAKDANLLTDASWDAKKGWLFKIADLGNIYGELSGWAQQENAATVLTAIECLRRQGLIIPNEAIKRAFAEVVRLTGLMGRWQTLQDQPQVVCDTGHNSGGWTYLGKQLQQIVDEGRALRMVIGMVNDKDIHSVLQLMPKDAQYFFTQPSNERALPADLFKEQALVHHLKGQSYSTVEEAVQAALFEASPDDFIFIGGSTFVVADALPLFMH